MPSRAIYQSTLLCVFLSVVQISCGKRAAETDPSAAASPPRISQIPLDAISSGGCLNITQYAQLLRDLDPGMPVRVTSKSFHMTSPEGLRENFRLVTAFGTFEHGLVAAAADEVNLHDYAQTGCEKITYEDGEGKLVEFKITASQPDFVSASAESGERISYRWISPQRLEVSTRYKVYDYPCFESFAFVEHARVLDWSGTNPPLLPEDAIDREFLTLVASATGASVDALYQDSPGGAGEKVLVSEKVSELTRGEIRAELLSCSD